MPTGDAKEVEDGPRKADPMTTPIPRALARIKAVVEALWESERAMGWSFTEVRRAAEENRDEFAPVEGFAQYDRTLGQVRSANGALRAEPTEAEIDELARWLRWSREYGRGPTGPTEEAESILRWSRTSPPTRLQMQGHARSLCAALGLGREGESK